MKIKVYSKHHTINVWVKVITKKFGDIPFMNRTEDIGNILNITSKPELNKINAASLIVFGNTLGITTFEEACEKLGRSTNIPKLDELDAETTIKFIAEYKLNIIIKALNEGWYPNWNDANEYKYFPYFKNKYGCGFSASIIDYHNTSTNVPSAHVFKTHELAMYCGLKFISLYKEYYK